MLSRDNRAPNKLAQHTLAEDGPQFKPVVVKYAALAFTADSDATSKTFI